MTNFADKGIVVQPSWVAIVVDGVVMAVAPAEFAKRIAETIRDAEEMAKELPPHRCPVCESDDSVVKDSRREGRTLRRTRECVSCNARWSTRERMVRLIRGGEIPDIDAIPDDSSVLASEILEAMSGGIVETDTSAKETP